MAALEGALVRGGSVVLRNFGKLAVVVGKGLVANPNVTRRAVHVAGQHSRRSLSAFSQSELRAMTNRINIVDVSARFASSKAGGSDQLEPGLLSKEGTVTDTDFMKGTPPEMRFVGPKKVTVKPSTSGGYPVVGDGINVESDIFGIPWSDKEIVALQKTLWRAGERHAFLPVRPAQPLTGRLAVLTRLAQSATATQADGSPGLLATGTLKEAVETQLPKDLLDDVLDVIRQFKDEKDPDRKRELGQQIHDISYWSHWLLQQYKFAGPYQFHFSGGKEGEQKSADFIPAPLSTIYAAANAAVGRHNEFVYDVYTLSSGTLPKDRSLDDVDFGDKEDIVRYVKSIKVDVGFMDVDGSEQYFRQCHTAMEECMKGAIEGIKDIMRGNLDGFDKVILGARRARLFFETMLIGSPSKDYPPIRLGILGKLGGLNSVFPPHLEFLEGVGTDRFQTRDGRTILGAYSGALPGQTGANSSMYKLFDILIRVAVARGAYPSDPESLQLMEDVLNGKRPVTDLNPNPVRMLQDAFDLFTRPLNHLDFLRTTHAIFDKRGITKKLPPKYQLKLLQLAVEVGQHRVRHLQYVLKSIYQMKAAAGQSRASGTGGAANSATFLQQFHQDTLAPAREQIAKLREGEASLSKYERQELDRLEALFNEQENAVARIVKKGNEIYAAERAGSGI